MDGHSSHYEPKSVDIAKEESVILFCLPPHTTQDSQPLDCTVFGPLKHHWSDVCHEFSSRNQVWSLVSSTSLGYSLKLGYVLLHRAISSLDLKSVVSILSTGKPFQLLMKSLPRTHSQATQQVMKECVSHKCSHLKLLHSLHQSRSRYLTHDLRRDTTSTVTRIMSLGSVLTILQLFLMNILMYQVS